MIKQKNNQIKNLIIQLKSQSSGRHKMNLTSEF